MGLGLTGKLRVQDGLVPALDKEGKNLDCRFVQEVHRPGGHIQEDVEPTVAEQMIAAAGHPLLTHT